MNRREFGTLVVAATAIGFKPRLATANEKLDPTDPQAVALGYVHDNAEVNKEKYAKFEPTQKCANCQLYQGTADDPWAVCPIFGARQVAGPGWCSAWVPKP